MNIPLMQPRDNRSAGDRCEVTLRDTFAAAAMTGLLCNGDFSMESIPSHAFSMADSMLRERERSKPPEPCAWKDGVAVAWTKQANHDAVPEAKATTAPLNKGAACNTATSGTGNTPTITAEEREAIEAAKRGHVLWAEEMNVFDDPEVLATQTTLRNLLERLK